MTQPMTVSFASPPLVASELLNNAAEHGMNDAGAHCQVRLMPHRMGNCTVRKPHELLGRPNQLHSVVN